VSNNSKKQANTKHENIIDGNNDVFTPKARLGIMTILAKEKTTTFKALKSLLGLTDGNLGAHMKVLEKENYIIVNKEFIDRKPNTTYEITSKGKQALIEHLNQLKSIIKLINE